MPDTLLKAEEKLSLRGRIWEVKPENHVTKSQLMRRGIASHMAGVLSSRGVSVETIDHFLKPTLRHYLPDPSRFKDMDKATSFIAEKIQADARICIWSDYDCDGATSAAVLGRFFKMIGYAEIPVFIPGLLERDANEALPVPTDEEIHNFYASAKAALRIPDRIHEGYGPNTQGLLDLKKAGFDTVCILDAGIVAFDPLAAAAEAGLNVVVIDHHAAEPTLPIATAVVNANRKDEAPGYEHLCAAGMTFVFCVSLARELNKKGWFDGKDGRPSRVPDLMTLLDIVALGTVADVVPLTTLNRAFVYQGLIQLGKREKPGLKYLAEVSGISPMATFTSEDLGWKFGPRINAGGRISVSTLGAYLLLTDDDTTARKLAERLDACNKNRKALEEDATKQSLEQLAGRTAGADRTIAIAVVNAHEGVVGISASRVKDAFDCPAIVLTQDHDGNLKGSARSVKGFDIGHAIIDARKKGLIVKGGGHGMAGGLTLTPEQLGDFETFMNEEIRHSSYFEDGISSEVDTVLKGPDLSVALIESFAQMAPFGTANPSPRVVLEGVVVHQVRILKEKHLKVELICGKETVDAIMWGAAGNEFETYFRSSIGRKIDIYGEPGINEFRGVKKLQMIAEDVRDNADSLL